MKYFIILLSFLFISCNSFNNDEIVLTSGISMNPDSPRYGISIKHNEIYYCEEIISSKGTYTYYKSEIDSNVFTNLRSEIEKSFKDKVKFKSIVDATPFQLNTSLGGDQQVLKFYLNNLNENQLKVILNLIELKKLKYKKISYYDFPKELLTERLPEPPKLKVQ